MLRQAMHPQKKTLRQYQHAAADLFQSNLHGKARPATNIDVEHTKIGTSSSFKTSNAPTKKKPNQYAHAAADTSRSDLHGKARPLININVETA